MYVGNMSKSAGAQGEGHVFTPVIGIALCVILIYSSYLCMTAAEEHYDDDNDLDYCNKDDDDDDVTPSQR